jgi:hypothetical protein
MDWLMGDPFFLFLFNSAWFDTSDELDAFDEMMRMARFNISKGREQRIQKSVYITGWCYVH